jgi:hypothetical protein
MGGGGTEQTTNGPSNPEVNNTLTRLLTGVQSTYEDSKTGGLPGALSSGWGLQYLNAQDPNYARGVSGATSELADIASGKRFGMDDPGYAAMREGALDDAMTGVGSSFLTDGRFGSTVMGDAAGKAATETLAGLDYGNFQNDQQRQMGAINALPTAFAAGQAPGSAIAAIGKEQVQAPWWNLGQASSILAGTAGAGGTTTTTPTAPWWQQVGGYVLGNASKAAGAF